MNLVTIDINIFSAILCPLLEYLAFDPQILADLVSNVHSITNSQVATPISPLQPFPGSTASPSDQVQYQIPHEIPEFSRLVSYKWYMARHSLLFHQCRYVAVTPVQEILSTSEFKNCPSSEFSSTSSSFQREYRHLHSWAHSQWQVHWCTNEQEWSFINFLHLTDTLYPSETWTCTHWGDIAHQSLTESGHSNMVVPISVLQAGKASSQALLQIFDTFDNLLHLQSI